MAKETKQFQAEVKQILDLMVHSLYSQKEIFLRELISNSSDALNKLRFEAISKPEWKIKTEDLHIRLTPDNSKKTLTIEDNGIGMSYEEVEKNIGTIAHSGTGAFLEKLKEAKNQPELIGQFGVGFYSVFMVADKVVLETQKPGEDGVRWESTGDGSYSIETIKREKGQGTSITLELKSDLEQDFTTEWPLRQIVTKHSNFTAFPIKMQITREVPELDSEGKPIEGKKEIVVEDETLNSQKAIWLKKPQDIKEQEYNDFYKHISHDWSDPLKSMHFNVEGTQEFSTLLYCPSQQPMDHNVRDQKWGLQLYVKQVFIMDHCEELIPQYLRFIKGVVDSSDLSLNVSREILQQDYQVQAIKKALTKKILSRLQDWQKSDRESFEKLWQLFGSTIKEGVNNDTQNKDKIVDLLLFQTLDQEKLTTLKEYIERKPPEQHTIFFMTGDNLAELRKSPVLERFSKKGFDVLLLTDPVDEWLTSSLDEYKEIKFQSVLDENLELNNEEEKKDAEEKIKAATKELEPLISVFKEQCEDNVKDVKLSSRLISSPVCLVSATHDPSARMERFMSSLGQEAPKTKRTLEVNPDHAIIKKMATFEKEKQGNWAKMLYTQALLQEGSPIENPVNFSQQLTEFMESL